MTLTPDQNKAINWMDREVAISILEDANVLFDDTDSVAVLRALLRSKIEDGTIDPSVLQ